MRVIRVVVPLLILSIQYYLYRKTIRALREGGSTGPLINVVTVLFILFNFLALFAMLQSGNLLHLPLWVRYSILYPLYIWQGGTFFTFLFLFLASSISGAFRGTVALVRVNKTAREKLDRLKSSPNYDRNMKARRAFLRNSAYVFAGASFAGTAYGMLIERTRVEVTSAEFFLPNLDPILDGFTIGLITDIHSSAYMPQAQMEKYVTLLNSLGCDLIAVNGDFINSSVEEVYPFTEAFSRLRAPYGVYGVMGNHDYYNLDPDRVAREVINSGIKLLFDENVSIVKNGASFSLLGVDDIGRGASAEKHIKSALGKTASGTPKVLLCHRPYYLPEASQLGIDLVLSGHTHGGQIVLGRVGETVLAPASLASQFVWGRYQIGDCSMYVSRGIGTVGVPVRINCPPEITSIILRSGSLGRQA